MEQKMKRNVYLLLGSISVILLLVCYWGMKENSFGRDLLLNLGTEVGGAVLLFFFLDKLLLRESSDDPDHIKEVINRELGTYFWEYDGSRRLQNAKFDLGHLLLGSQEVCILTYYGSALLSFHQDNLELAVRQGLNVRFIYLDKDAPSLGELENEKQSHIVGRIAAEENLLRSIESDSKKAGCKGSFCVKKIRWLPSISLIIAKHNSGEISVKVSINPVTPGRPFGDVTRKRGRHCLAFNSRTHEEEVAYYTSHFDYLWGVCTEAFTPSKEK